MQASVQGDATRPAVGYRFLVLWVVANTIAWGVGLGVPVFAGIALFNSLSIEAETGDSTSLLGFVVAICVMITAFPVAISVGQWLVLRRQISGVVWWIPATVIGIVGGMIVFLPSEGTLPGWIGLGALIAIPQWLVLQQQVSGAAWWIPACIVAAIIWKMLFREITGLFLIDVFLPFATGAVVTGSVLVWLLRRSEPSQMAQVSPDN